MISPDFRGIAYIEQNEKVLCQYSNGFADLANQIWIIDNPSGKDYVYMQGRDDGVSALSEYNPNNGMLTVLFSNFGDNVWKLMRDIRKAKYWVETRFRSGERNMQLAHEMEYKYPTDQQASIEMVSYSSAYQEQYKTI